MSFMDLETTGKGALYACDCAKCGATLYTHEWAYMDHNERRDAMKGGTLRCDHCVVGKADPNSFQAVKPIGKWCAGRYSAPGYLDCTDWEYDTNWRRLERTLRDLYGEE